MLPVGGGDPALPGAVVCGAYLGGAVENAPHGAEAGGPGHFAGGLRAGQRRLGGGATASLPGIALGVASGLCYASYTVFAHYGMAHYSSYTMIYWTFLVAGLGSVLLADFSALGPILRQPKGALGCVLVIVVSTALPYYLYTKGLEGVESGRASIITNIEPVVESLMGVVVFHERMTGWMILGVACVLGAVMLLASGKEADGAKQRA